MLNVLDKLTERELVPGYHLACAQSRALISELKQILLDTYYGRDYVEGETAAKKEAAPAKAEKKAKKSA